MLDQCPTYTCGVLSSNFDFGFINLILIVIAFVLWNKVYNRKYTFMQIDKMNEQEKIHYAIDKILLGLFLLNLASVFFAITNPLIAGL